ncbi:MAG: AAA family ATPase [Actinomycetota bacterium]
MRSGQAGRGSTLLLAGAAGASLALPAGRAATNDASWAEVVLAVAAPLLVVAVMVNLLVVLWSIRHDRVDSPAASRAALIPGTTLDGLIGLDVAAERLREPARRLREPDPVGAERTGGRGLLLVGQPGTGRSMIARATAGEACAPLLALRCAETATRRPAEQVTALRELFDEARAQAPAVVFLDEVHCLAGIEPPTASGSPERRRVVEHLGTELDAVAANPRIVVLASTSRPDLLDRTVSTPGRLDAVVPVAPPDRAARVELLRLHAVGRDLAADVDLTEVAAKTPGCVGHDLRAVIDEAATLTRRDGRRDIRARDLDVAVDRIVHATDAAARLLSREERERLAFHQAGHAIVTHLLPGAPDVDRITILDRRPGRPLELPADAPQQLLSRAEMVDGVVALLAGRCAEIHVFGDCSTTAEADIAAATAMARAMVTRFGMDRALGPMRLADADVDPEVVEQRVAEMLARSERDALDLLATHATTVQHLALALIVHETIDRRAFRSIVGELPAWGPTIDLRTTHDGLDGPGSIDRSAPRFSP